MIDGGLRKEFKNRLPLFHWQAIESGLTGQGILDSNFCYQSIEGWIEFKKTDKNLITLEPEQVGWIANRIRHGGLVKVAVRVQQHGLEHLLIFDGSMVYDMKSRSISENFHAVQCSYQGPPRSWNWNDIAVAITTKGSTPP